MGLHLHPIRCQIFDTLTESPSFSQTRVCDSDPFYDLCVFFYCRLFGLVSSKKNNTCFSKVISPLLIKTSLISDVWCSNLWSTLALKISSAIRSMTTFVWLKWESMMFGKAFDSVLDKGAVFSNGFGWCVGVIQWGVDSSEANPGHLNYTSYSPNVFIPILQFPLQPLMLRFSVNII